MFPDAQAHSARKRFLTIYPYGDILWGHFMGTFSSLRLISRAIAFLIEKRLIVRASSGLL